MPFPDRDRPAAFGTIWRLLANVAIALAVFRVIIWSQGDWTRFAQVQLDILTGHPHGREQGARILTSYALAGLTRLGLPVAEAFHLLVALGLVAYNLALSSMLGRMGLPRDRALLLVCVSALAIVFLNDDILYLWDIADLLVFLCLGWLILRRAPPLAFALLFACAFLNRESALFVPLGYLFTQVSPGGSAPWPRVDRAGALLGLGQILAGAALVKFLRDSWYISHPDGSLDPAHATFGNHFYLGRNLGDVFYWNWDDYHLLHTLPLLLGIGWAAAAYRRLTDPERSLVLLMGAYLAAVMVFGWINETRMLFPLVPMAILLWAARTTTAEGAVRDG